MSKNSASVATIMSFLSNTSIYCFCTEDILYLKIHWNVMILFHIITGFYSLPTEYKTILSQLGPRIRPLHYKFRHYQSGAEGPYCIHQALVMKRSVRFINIELDCMQRKNSLSCCTVQNIYVIICSMLFCIMIVSHGVEQWWFNFLLRKIRNDCKIILSRIFFPTSWKGYDI